MVNRIVREFSDYIYLNGDGENSVGVDNPLHPYDKARVKYNYYPGSGYDASAAVTTDGGRATREAELQSSGYFE